MSAIQPLVFVLSLLLAPAEAPLPDLSAADVPRLREMLLDRTRPREQSQAALVLVQSNRKEAAQVVHRGLRQTDAPEVIQALLAAIRFHRDRRFTDDLLDLAADAKSSVRSSALETLAVLADEDLVKKLKRSIEDDDEEASVRQAALWVLGRCGRKAAAAILIEQLGNNDELLQRAAVEALTEMTGQDFKLDRSRWRSWWDSHKDLPPDAWLAERVAYQTSRTRRLEGDLERARAQVVRLHQQLYSRLAAAERLGFVKSLLDHEDAGVRTLAVGWSVELLPATDAVGQRDLTDALLRLARDPALEVQRPAVLALGRTNEPRSFDRLRSLLRRGEPSIRAAATHAITQQVMGSSPEAKTRRKEVVPILQKALDDPALEVVVAAAENLGSLGIPEAGPVLAALLSHTSEPVRLTAAQALERVADPKVLDGLTAALDDSSVPVRFSLVGALGRVAGDTGLADEPRSRLVARLEEVLLRDGDAGVRSRAATVLGQHAPAEELPFLWRRVQSREEPRVQEKAWSAMIDIIARQNSLELLRDWDRTLSESKQPQRRLDLLAGACNRWKDVEGTKNLVDPATELLVQAHLDQGKWTAAYPLVRSLLARAGSDSDLERRLRYLLNVGEMALVANNKAEAKRAVTEAQPFLTRKPDLAGDFAKLEKRAQ